MSIRKCLNLSHYLVIPIIFGIIILTMSSSVVKAGEEEVVLNVKGMVCGACENAVKSQLKKVDGVKDADADWKKGKAVIKVEEGKAKPDELIKAVEKAGFSASES